MPGSIHTPRFARMLQRLFSVKGGETGVLVDDIMPVAEVMDPTQADVRVLRGEQLWNAYQAQGPVAAQYSKWHLVNPATSGSVLATVESIILENTSASTVAFVWGITATALPAVGTNALARDSRMIANGVRNSVTLLSGSDVANPVPVLTGGIVTLPAGGFFAIPNPWQFVLHSGYEFQVAQATVNLSGQVAMAWSERQAEDSELQRIIL